MSGPLPYPDTPTTMRGSPMTLGELERRAGVGPSIEDRAAFWRPFHDLPATEVIDAGTTALRQATRPAELPYARTLTASQRIALARFAVLRGPGWKDALRADWMEARAEPALHRLRNTHGPAWLAELTMPEDGALS